MTIVKAMILILMVTKIRMIMRMIILIIIKKIMMT